MAPKKTQKPDLIVLFRITATAAKKMCPKEFKEGMRGLRGVFPGDIDWFITDTGRLWTNDALDDHGWTFFDLSQKNHEGIDIHEVKVLNSFDFNVPK